MSSIAMRWLHFVITIDQARLACSYSESEDSEQNYSTSEILMVDALGENSQLGAEDGRRIGPMEIFD